MNENPRPKRSVDPDQAAPEWQKNVALLTNAGGVAAAPGALYAAYRAAKRNEGGIPRQLMHAVGDEGSKSSVRRGLKAGANFLDSGTSSGAGRAARIAAGAAGGGLIALQAGNAFGDAVSTQLIASQKKKDKERQKRISTGGANDIVERTPTTGVGKAIDYESVIRPQREVSRGREAAVPGLAAAGVSGAAGAGYSGYKINSKINEASRGTRVHPVSGKEHEMQAKKPNLLQRARMIVEDPVKPAGASPPTNTGQAPSARGEKPAGSAAADMYRKSRTYAKRKGGSNLIGGKSGGAVGDIARDLAEHKKLYSRGKLAAAGAALAGASAIGLDRSNKRKEWT